MHARRRVGLALHHDELVVVDAHDDLGHRAARHQPRHTVVRGLQREDGDGRRVDGKAAEHRLPRFTARREQVAP